MKSNLMLRCNNRSIWLRIFSQRYRFIGTLLYGYFCCYLFLIASLSPLTGAVILANGAGLSSNLQSKSNLIEGSGSFPSGMSKDSSEWQASGVNPDDEPGDDVEEGSGSIVEGSGSTVQLHDGSRTAIMPTVPRTPSEVLADNRNSDLSSLTSSVLNPAVSIPPSLHDLTTTSVKHNSFNLLPTTSNTLFKTTTTTTSTTVRTHTITKPATTTITTSTTRKPFIAVNTRPPPPPPPPELPPYVTESDSFEMLKPGILAAVSGGAVVGVLMTILLIMFIVYRMRKKDEGSYSLDEPHQPPNYSYAYQKASTKEFYA